MTKNGKNSDETCGKNHFFKNGAADSISALNRWVHSPSDSSGTLTGLLRNVVRVLMIMFSELKRNDIALRSGALTYTVLLSLVPLLAMSTAVVKGLGGGDQLRDVAYGYIDSITPSPTSAKDLTLEQVTFQQQSPTGDRSSVPSTPPATPAGEESAAVAKADDSGTAGMATHMRSAVDKLFNYVDKTNFATLGTFGVVGILLSVILVLGNIEMAMNAIWHVESSRSIIRKVSDYLTLLILMPISINVAFAASAFLKNPTLASKFEMLFPFQWLETLILKLIPVFFISLTLYIIYIFFPNTKVRSLPAAIGAVLAAIAWFVVQNAYITLQVGVSKYNAIYGSFATLPLFLVWMYLGWLFILGGAQIAYACQHINSYSLRSSSSSPARKLGAALDIMSEVTAGYQTHQSVTVNSLADKLSAYSARLIEEAVADLQKAELLYLTAIQEQLLPAGNYSKQMIVDAILGTDAADTPGGQSSLRMVSGVGALTGQDVVNQLSGSSSSGKRQEGESST
ncbi:YihY/virulence factor BrkB family protein [Desulfosediminicola ganghwensis]|uniref:YihY/virulence factor BrkB family protein n=1 Tax=Desulfosediminicola ganghwensis TaxID=2569540 RepID=UPI001E557922|nr:YihY/virulence factor BrkB family protein [Desulfosediminicola ganghwensis]